MAGGRTLNVDALMAVLNGSPTFQETVATTSPTAAKNVTAFAPGATIVFQSDTAVYFSTGDSSVATTSSAFSAPAGQITVLVLPLTDTYISFLAVSGTS